MSNSELRAAIEFARVYDRKVIAEAEVIGRDIECGVLEGRGQDLPRTSVLGEPIVLRNHLFYDYNAKYIDLNDIDLKIPADLPDHVTQQIRALSARVFEEFGCEGLARVDFFYTERGEILLNEINTMPGFTPSSMYPLLWAATGVSYTQLVDELIQLALHREVGLR